MTTTPKAAAADSELSALVIGVLGGTGKQGRGLARRLALAGQTVVIGSRDAGRAAEAAATVGAAPQVRGASNEDAAAAADVVIVTVPWDGHRELLASLAGRLAGKIVIDCVSPLGFDSRGAYCLPVPEGSAAQQAAAVLPGSRVVGAFHHVSAVLLLDPDVEALDSDILVLGDDREAADLVRALAELLPGARGVYAGRLRNCGQVEALTANLVAVNRQHKTHAGVRITDI
jgi:NADPH-dependent F420 reductase